MAKHSSLHQSDRLGLDKGMHPGSVRRLWDDMHHKDMLLTSGDESQQAACKGCTTWRPNRKLSRQNMHDYLT